MVLTSLHVSTSHFCGAKVAALLKAGKISWPATVMPIAPLVGRPYVAAVLVVEVLIYAALLSAPPFGNELVFTLLMAGSEVLSRVGKRGILVTEYPGLVVRETHAVPSLETETGGLLMEDK